ncbi:energy transducer TonB [Flavobacterium artemisiae]|uniref:Energy transducer TonB n=1 Tax=Flavobacterium artemisiae TaxID=2126556 RepID=A0ABW4HEG4_9FLAO
MERKYKITIPEPCHEDWNKMTPKDNGRFCLNCSKTVVDFTAMMPEEIQHFFIQNQNENVCGRFRKSQLDTITIQIPSRVLYTQTHYSKMFLLALFIAMGTTLFSCADNKGNKHTIDKIEVIEEQINKEVYNDNKKDSLISNKPLQTISPIAIIEEPKVGIGVEAVYESHITGMPAIQPPICVLEKLPDYPGGLEKFYDLIRSDFKIPKKAKRSTGEIEVSFVIEKNGILNQIKVFDNIGHETGEEIVRVLQKSKKWIPGFVDDRDSVVMRLKILVEKDTLNNRKRNLSKITTIDLVKANNTKISLANNF